MNESTDNKEPVRHAGTRTGNKSPYKYITVDGKLIREHRYVMEEVLGRPLLPTEVVHHKDGNKKNNVPENLEVMNWGDHSKEHLLSREHKSGTSIEVSCFDMQGNLVKTYESYAEAYRDGHGYDRIKACIAGDIETYHNMYWKNTGERTQIVKNRTVYQIDPKTGETVASYPSLTEASKQSGRNIWSIEKCCKGTNVMHDGYNWSYTNDAAYIEQLMEKFSHLGEKPKVPIKAYDAWTGEFLEDYDNIADAVRQHPDYDAATIFSCCIKEGKYMMHKQRIWRFADDTEPVEPVKQFLVAFDKKTGKLVKVYRKVIDAKRIDGCAEPQIYKSINNDRFSHKGCKWKLLFVDQLPANFKEFLVESAPSSIGPARKKGNRVILQSNAKTGKPVAVYDMIITAVKYTGLDRTMIGSCCRGDQKETGGFTWTYITPDQIPAELPKDAIHIGA